MSRIGKNPISIPAQVSVSFDEGARVLRVKGPKGELERQVRPEVAVAVADGEVRVSTSRRGVLARALWGTTASHIRNMIKGVTEGWSKTLEVHGVGYRAEVAGNALKLLVGYSHPVLLPIPQGISVSVEKNVITVSGIDKEAVGQFAAQVRKVRKPEPYKGKGIRYQGEYIRMKEGKKGA
ncbi:MAG: 50S ribosomal protein L6 [Candidatus Parcubacteria bacterium]|nr:MAG: 50S ribosomal protein L6 [Candidatus Parcubacteria bacterium]